MSWKWELAMDDCNYSVEKVEAEEDVRDVFEKIDSNSEILKEVNDVLKGSPIHSKLMCVLQYMVYGDVEYNIVEVRNHDLVDKENKVMAEVGTNYSGSEVFRFAKRVFSFLEKYDLEEPLSWKFYHLTYDFDLYRLNLSEKGVEKFYSKRRSRIEDHREFQNSVSL